jgi:hypothetical protein
MATTTTLMFTALPNGGPDPYRLSLFVSPRLEGMGPTGLLQDYNLGNWPNKLRTLLTGPTPVELELNVAGGLRVRLEIRPEYIAGLDEALWDAIFPLGGTRVTPRVFKDLSKRWLRSYQVRATENYIQGLYNTIANQYPDNFPDLKGTTPITKLTGVVGQGLRVLKDAAQIPFFPADREWSEPKVYKEFNGRGRATHPDAGVEAQLTSLAASLGASEIPLAELFRGYRFFKRGNQGKYRSKESRAGANWNPAIIQDRPETPKLDFHRTVAALGDHALLLRKLGLIIDGELIGVRPILQQHIQMQVLMPPTPGIAYLTPWTRYQINATSGFRPTPRAGGDILHGMLRLDSKDNFDLIQSDPDGNLIKVFDYAVNMDMYRSKLLLEKAQNPNTKTSQAPEETSLPALRSGGLMVVRNKRDDQVWDKLDLQRGFESNADAAVLFADDVLRGYRVDVLYRGQWHSLCRWLGTYKVAGLPSIDHPGPDEGYIKSDSASSDDAPVMGPQEPDLYLHETVYGWRNWSLVTEVPGKTIEPQPQADKRQLEKVKVPNNQPGPDVNFTWVARTEKQSLPPLRYGETYRFRARAVDLAGNSWGPPPSANDPVPAGDAVPAGTPISESIRFLRHDPVPAPMALLAAKVTEGESMGVSVIRSRGDAAPLPFPASLMINESQMFNTSNIRWFAAPKTTVGEAEAHKMFDSLFTTPQVAYDLLKKESGTFDDPTVAGTTILDIAGNVVPYPPTPTYMKGDPLPDGMYWIHTEDPVLLPYLPDPLAHGVAFMPQDGTGTVLYKPFAGAAWPDAAPFKLVLKGGAMGFALPPDPAEVTVPRGERLIVKYASVIVPPGSATPGELDLMARWNSMTAAGRAVTQAHGFQHWMMSPGRTMVFVHAVEKPIQQPVIVQLSHGKSPGDTFITFRNGQVALHSPSTGELALRARFDDYVDDPLDETGFHIIPKDAHVFDRPVEYDESPVLIPPPSVLPGLPSGLPEPRHEFGDTKHRNVRYRMLGTTRYREYFPAKLWNYEDPVTRQKLITTEGPEFAIANVRSSARPLAPDPLYIVPTFKWVNTATGRQRLGRGLRIYLNRGWFSSGEGELLGVTMFPPGTSFNSATADRLRTYVSQWGEDPMWEREFGDTTNGSMLDPSHFVHDPLYPDTAPGPVDDSVLLTEEPLSVRVQGFKVHWDAERKLWYVDLEFAQFLPAHYYTFVRLGLCRYQPDSLPNLEISKVVRAEFAQLLGDRFATLTKTADSINIVLSGASALSSLGKFLNSTGQTALSTLPHTLAPGEATEKAAESATSFGQIIIDPTPQPNPQAGAGHRIMAYIESRTKGLSGDLGWEPIDNGVRLASYTGTFSFGNVSWQGSVRWPRTGLPANKDYRLVLREYEIYETDADVAEAFSGGGSSIGKFIRGRLVYTDVFPLDAMGPVFTT